MQTKGYITIARDCSWNRVLQTSCTARVWTVGRTQTPTSSFPNLRWRLSPVRSKNFTVKSSSPNCLEHKAEYSNMPASVELRPPNFFFVFFSACLLLYKKVLDGVQYHPSDLECYCTRKQHKHQAFSLTNLLITPLAREILEWRHESYSTQIQFDRFFTR